MIIKLEQGMNWESYKRRSRVVKAIKIKEDFLFETTHGWIQGHKGQWLVELGPYLRCSLDHQAFTRCYKPASKQRGVSPQ